MAVRDVPMSGTADPPEDAATASTNVSKATDGGAKDGPPAEDEEGVHRGGAREAQDDGVRVSAPPRERRRARGPRARREGVRARGDVRRGRRREGGDRGPARARRALLRAPREDAGPRQDARRAFSAGVDEEDADGTREGRGGVEAAAPASSPAAPTPLGWLPEGVVRNLSILWGACLGAAYEVATMPTTVQNFNKAVYAATGMLGEYLPRWPTAPWARSTTTPWSWTSSRVGVFRAQRRRRAGGGARRCASSRSSPVTASPRSTSCASRSRGRTRCARGEGAGRAVQLARAPAEGAYGAALGATVVVVEIFDPSRR